MKLDIQNKLGRILAAILLAAAVIGMGAANVSAETIYASTVNNRLLSFDSASPCTTPPPVRVTGMQEGEKLLGIDFRPATGELYGLGSSSRLYVIDTITGVATAIGSAPFTPALDGDSFGFDFNPTVDRVRVVSNTGQNLRLHPVTGVVAFTDMMLSYATGDPNFGILPSVSGAAYTNPDRDPATGTTLFDLDIALNTLTTQLPPNDGRLNTIGTFGLKANDVAGFDISTSNTAYAAVIESGLTRPGGRRCGTSTLVTINLTTGAATSLGTIGSKPPVRGLAAYIAP